jgi:hypothetical protein
MILKGFGFVAFFAGVKASSLCIHLSCLVCSVYFWANGVVCFVVIYVIIVIDCEPEDGLSLSEIYYSIPIK